MRTAARVILGMLLVLLALEGVMRLLPVSTATLSGYHFHPNIVTYPAHHHFIMATGWDLQRVQRHRSNNFGFLSRHEFEPDPNAVALVGDSFVEANMLPASERLDAQLEARLATRRVYALGGPGSSLLDYAERVRFAADRFAIKDFVVVIEQGDIKQTLCGSGNIHGPCLDPDDLRPRIERLPEADAGKRLLRHSAFAQYLVSQLQVNPGRLLKRIDPRQWLDTSERSKRDSAAPATTVERDTRIVTAFLTYLPRSNGERYVLIFDSPLRQRSDDASHSASTVMFMAQARQAGLRVLDTAPIFRAQLDKANLALHVSPRDTHWNGLANSVVAQALLPYLSQ